MKTLERIIPDKYIAEIKTKDFSIPEEFLWLKKSGNIKSKEMLKTFNCGVGLILIAKVEDSKEITNFISK